MPVSSSKLLLTFFLLVVPGLGLQVSPGSSCSSVCIDNINEDPSDPNSSNTYGTDISCNDADYASDTGTKFEKCENCLQNSTYTSSGESDLHWFLYNIRYAVDWCLYGYPNNTEAGNSPCLTEDACGTLATALESDLLNTTNSTTYNYCTADGGAFLGEHLSGCTQCLENLDNQAYLANFVIALEAACEQRPTGDLLLGLQGSLFSKTVVNITSPTVSPSSSAHKHSSLSIGGRIGIAVGCLVFALFLIGFLFVFFKKRQARHDVHSNFDARYGAHDISGPNSGAFMNAQYTPSQQYPTAAAMQRTNLTPKAGVQFTAGDYYDQQQYSQHKGAPLPPYQPTTYVPPAEYAPDKVSALPVHGAYLSSAKPGSGGEKYAMDAYPTSTTANSSPTTIRTTSHPSSPDAGTVRTSLPTPAERAPSRTASRNVSAVQTSSSRSPSLAKKSPSHLSVSPAYSGTSPSMPLHERRGEEVAPPLQPPNRQELGRNWSPDSPRSVEQWPGEY